MKATKEQIRAMLAVQGMEVPENELDDVVLRFSTWMASLDEIEAELGSLMDEIDPIPPIYPREGF